MTISPRLWLATFVALVFAIGTATGVLVDRLWLVGPPGPPPGRGMASLPGLPDGPPPNRIVSDLDARLHLTDAQRQQIVSILEAHRPRVRELQDSARQLFVNEQQALHDDITKVLTPAQADQFKAMIVGPEGPGRGRPGGPRGRGRPGGPRGPSGPPGSSRE